MVYLLKMVIFHGYVSLPGGILYLVAELPNPWFIRFDLVSTATESWAASIASFWWTGVTCASCHEQHRSAHISIACVYIYIYIILKEMQYGLFKDILILVMFLSQFRTAYMCIYMCVCKCLYSYIYMCVCACVCVSRSLSLHCQRIFRAYIYIYICIYMCVCACVFVKRRAEHAYMLYMSVCV